jgi:hypothetical protein
VIKNGYKSDNRPMVQDWLAESFVHRRTELWLARWHPMATNGVGGEAVNSTSEQEGVARR